MEDKKELIDEIIKEIGEDIKKGKERIIEDKKVVTDKKTGQFSLKLPKNTTRGLVDDNTEFIFVANPSLEDLNLASKSYYIIYAKEKKHT